MSPSTGALLGLSRGARHGEQSSASVCDVKEKRQPLSTAVRCP